MIGFKKIKEEIMNWYANNYLKRNHKRKKSRHYPELEENNLENQIEEIELSDGSLGFCDGGWGSERCAVIIPPLGENYRSMAPLSNALSERRISSFVLNYNGFKKKEREPSSFNIDELINEVDFTLNIANLSYKSVSLIGSCFGADIAYLTASEKKQSIEKVVLHAPIMPFFSDLLEEYLPQASFIKKPIGNFLAKKFRGTNKISLSEILGKYSLYDGFDQVLFNQDEIRKYLIKKPKRINEFPLILIGTKDDNFIPEEHTRKVAERLKEIHKNPYIKYISIKSDHFLFRRYPETVAQIVANARIPLTDYAKK